MPAPEIRSTRTPSGPDARVARVEELLREHERALVGYAARLLGGDVERARDVVQETFLRLCRQADIDGLGREWLFAVTRNLCVDVRRKEAPMNRLEEGHDAPDAAGDASAAAIADDAAGELGRAIDRLPDRQREALRLKFESELSYAEIARVMEISAGTVGWLLHTAIKSLRAGMAPEGGAR
ncbi:MAG: sigma-70 family RNA polymerase sigma factor [Planctomycetota bacterium]